MTEEIMTALSEQLLVGLTADEHIIEPEPYDAEATFLSSADFLDQDARLEWHCENILVAGQPAVIGGAKKTLKTSLAVDLAVSIATGESFLRRFHVEHPVPVGIVSGESGVATLQETFRRICFAKMIEDPRAVPVYWRTRMPQFSAAADVDHLAQEVEQHGLKVLFLDPLYLCLLIGLPNVQAANLYQIGPLLADIAGVCLRAGATPVLIHHLRKGAVATNKPPELEDLAFAGIQEFARQWLLIGRRANYQPGTGEHQLWLNVGGSAGFSGCWAVDISEGYLRQDFSGRRWGVAARTAGEEHQAAANQREQERENRARLAASQDMAAVVRVLNYRGPAGETCTGLAGAAGISQARAQRAIQALLEAGQVEDCMVQKPGGRGSHEYPGFCLVARDEDRLEDLDDDIEDGDGGQVDDREDATSPPAEHEVDEAGQLDGDGDADQRQGREDDRVQGLDNGDRGDGALGDAEDNVDVDDGAVDDGAVDNVDGQKAEEEDDRESPVVDDSNNEAPATGDEEAQNDQ
jgi:hypothetical protein